MKKTNCNKCKCSTTNAAIITGKKKMKAEKF